MSAALLRRKLARSSLHDSDARVIDLPALLSMMELPAAGAPSPGLAVQKSTAGDGVPDKETQRVANQLSALGASKDSFRTVSPQMAPLCLIGI
jgi:hypothetical protein